MPAIVTLTFSPCIDKTASVPYLEAEKKLHCSAPTLEPGGGGINVARVIKRLGLPVIAVYPSGGYSGKFLDHLMRKEEVESVTIETENETRENIIIVDESSNNQYRFGMPANALSEHEWKACLDAVTHIPAMDYLVVSGSMPPGVPLSVFKELPAIARSKNARLVVDTSGPALKEAIHQGVYMLKPNLGELSSLAGTNRLGIDKVEETARHVLNEYGCEILVVSMGKDGAMLVSKDEAFIARSPDVPRKSTVGAGDSMVAGIVYSLTREKSLKNALLYGIACGTAATMNPGTELCHKDDADRLYRMIAG